MDQINEITHFHNPNIVSSKSHRIRFNLSESEFSFLIRNGTIDIGDSINESKYAILSTKDDIQSAIVELQRGWAIKRPEIILSIIGGTNNYGLSNQTKVGFKNSLVKIAQCTNAFIITDGINCGVSKLVGEVMANYRDEINLIGINDISKIYRGQTLVYLKTLMQPLIC